MILNIVLNNETGQLFWNSMDVMTSFSFLKIWQVACFSPKKWYLRLGLKHCIFAIFPSCFHLFRVNSFQLWNYYAIFLYLVGEQLTNDTVAMILQVNER